MNEFNINVEGGSSVRLPTAGKYCDRDIIVTANKNEDLNWNYFINKWGAGSYELDALFYTESTIENYGKFVNLHVNKVFLTQVKEIPQDCFFNSEIHLSWFGGLNNPSQGKLQLDRSAFMGCMLLEHLVLNFDEDPLNVLKLEENSLQGTMLENNMGCLYVPENRVAQWQEAIDNFEITNLFFWTQVKPISSLFEEGGYLYDTVLPSE